MNPVLEDRENRSFLMLRASTRDPQGTDPGPYVFKPITRNRTNEHRVYVEDMREPATPEETLFPDPAAGYAQEPGNIGVVNKKRNRIRRRD